MDLFKHRAGAYQKGAGKAAETPASPAPPASGGPGLVRKVAPPATAPANPSGDKAVRPANAPGRADIARYLILVGSDEAAKILSHLGEAEAEAIAREISAIEAISADEAKTILAKFSGLVKTPAGGPAKGGSDVARSILKAAFGEERADRLYRQAIPPVQEELFAFLHDFDARQVHALLRPEPVAVRSIVLAWLPPQLAAGIIKLCTSDEQKDIIKRLATMQRIDREVLQRIDQTLRDRARDSARMDNEEVDGKASLANIMRHLDPGTEQGLLDELAVEAPELAQEIRERLFTIETILLIDDKDLQKVLATLDDRVIALLLKGKSDAIRQKILTNVSDSRAGLIRDEYRLLGPQPRRDVDHVTREFIATLKILENDGTIRVRREDEEYV